MPSRFSTITTAVITGFILGLTCSQSQGAGLPVATTLGAVNVTSSSGRINGQVNPNGAQTYGYFQLGTTTNYGTSG